RQNGSGPAGLWPACRAGCDGHSCLAIFRSTQGFRMPRSVESSHVHDLRGASRLVIDAVAGVTDLVEAMHGTIARVSPPIGTAPAKRAGGIPGLVYSSVRGVTRAVGAGLDVA